MMMVSGLGLALVQSIFAQAPGSPSSAPQPVPAAMKVVDQDAMKVLVKSFDGTKIWYGDPTQPAGASVAVSAASVERFAFELTLDEEGLNRERMARNWNQVCVLLWPVVSPVLPFMGIRNNNAADLAMILGDSLVKAAALMRSAKGGDAEKAARIVQRALSVYMALGKAEWYSEAEAARLKGILCQIDLKDLKQADRDFRMMRVPEIGDQTMGLYWYVAAALKEANGKTRDAMDAVVKSIAFENKDVDVFPDALMMSARLYEALLEPYRARDVYYEVARLFPGTDWATTARVRLQSIMDQKLTQSKEVIGIERTFFGLDEDVNAKAASLLKGTLDEDKPEAEESMEAEPVEGAKTADGDKEKEAGTEAPAAPRGKSRP